MLIDGSVGTLILPDGTRPMPPAMLAHGRSQFGIYGLMRLVDLDGGRMALAPAIGELSALRIDHLSAPPTTLLFEADGRLAGALNQVSDPEDQAKPPIDQVFTFEGEIVSNGVRWPRIISIIQNGEPYFDLTLSGFEARAAI